MRHVEVSIQIGVHFLIINVRYNDINDWEFTDGYWQENNGDEPEHHTNVPMVHSQIQAWAKGTIYGIDEACETAVANDIGLGQTNSNYKNEK